MLYVSPRTAAPAVVLEAPAVLLVEVVVDRVGVVGGVLLGEVLVLFGVLVLLEIVPHIAYLQCDEQVGAGGLVEEDGGEQRRAGEYPGHEGVAGLVGRGPFARFHHDLGHPAVGSEAVNDQLVERRAVGVVVPAARVAVGADISYRVSLVVPADPVHQCLDLALLFEVELVDAALRKALLLPHAGTVELPAKIEGGLQQLRDDVRFALQHPVAVAEAVEGVVVAGGDLPLFLVEDLDIVVIAEEGLLFLEIFLLQDGPVVVGAGLHVEDLLRGLLCPFLVLVDPVAPGLSGPGGEDAEAAVPMGVPAVPAHAGAEHGAVDRLEGAAVDEAGLVEEAGVVVAAALGIGAGVGPEDNDTAVPEADAVVVLLGGLVGGPVPAGRALADGEVDVLPEAEVPPLFDDDGEELLLDLVEGGGGDEEAAAGHGPDPLGGDPGHAGRLAEAAAGDEHPELLLRTFDEPDRFCVEIDLLLLCHVAKVGAML